MKERDQVFLVRVTISGVGGVASEMLVDADIAQSATEQEFLERFVAPCVAIAFREFTDQKLKPHTLFSVERELPVHTATR